MEGMLTQDEINALLNGMDLSEESGSAPAEESQPPQSDSQSAGEVLSDMERDAVGEIANISMGSSATSLFTLVNQKVNITTPVVSIANWENLLQSYEKPCVFIQIQYTEGLDGSNILVLKEQDVKIIADLMMGGDGTNTSGELGELHLSAISEAMNQMMGASATSLSQMFGNKIDISPPEASLLDLTTIVSGSEISPFLGGPFVKVAFRMQIGTLVDSTIMQLYPIEFSKKLVDRFINQQMGAASESAPAKQPKAAEPAGGMQRQADMQPQTDMSQAGMGQMDMGQMGMPQMGMGQMGMPQMGMGQMGMPQMGMPQMGMGQMGMPQMGMPQMGMGQMGMPQMGMGQMGMPQMGMQPNVNIQPAQFQSFNQDVLSGVSQENINLIMDVPLEVTVELGRTTKSIADILDFAPGTIIELDRIAGDPIDVMVNGKFVARGEVMVIEECFAIRVTEIIK